MNYCEHLAEVRGELCAALGLDAPPLAMPHDGMKVQRGAAGGSPMRRRQSKSSVGLLCFDDETLAAAAGACAGGGGGCGGGSRGGQQATQAQEMGEQVLSDARAVYAAMGLASLCTRRDEEEAAGAPPCPAVRGGARGPRHAPAPYGYAAGSSSSMPAAAAAVAVPRLGHASAMEGYVPSLGPVPGWMHPAAAAAAAAAGAPAYREAWGAAASAGGGGGPGETDALRAQVQQQQVLLLHQQLLLQQLHAQQAQMMQARAVQQQKQAAALERCPAAAAAARASSRPARRARCGCGVASPSRPRRRRQRSPYQQRLQLLPAAAVEAGTVALACRRLLLRSRRRSRSSRRSIPSVSREVERPVRARTREGWQCCTVSVLCVTNVISVSFVPFFSGSSRLHACSPNPRRPEKKRH
jgi:hypothetical protein